MVILCLHCSPNAFFPIILQFILNRNPSAVALFQRSCVTTTECNRIIQKLQFEIATKKVPITSNQSGSVCWRLVRIVCRFRCFVAKFLLSFRTRRAIGMYFSYLNLRRRYIALRNGTIKGVCFCFCFLLYVPFCLLCVCYSPRTFTEGTIPLITLQFVEECFAPCTVWFSGALVSHSNFPQSIMMLYWHRNGLPQCGNATTTIYPSSLRFVSLLVAAHIFPYVCQEPLHLHWSHRIYHVGRNTFFGF